MAESTFDWTARANPGEYSPRERMIRVLRGQPTDRLPIVPTALTPFTWHAEYPVYRPILDVAVEHCEFMASYYLPGGLALCDPATLDLRVERSERDGRKFEHATLRTPRGELTQDRMHDPVVGGWTTSKFYVNNDDDLAAWLSLPFAPVRPDLSGVLELEDKLGEFGLAYLNGIHDALQLATGMMGEEYRIMFCFGEPDRLQSLVEQQQQRLGEYLTWLLDELDRLGQRRPPAGPGRTELPVGPVLRWYAMEPYVEPIQPPRFVDRFIVPYDRELVKLIHDRGRFVVTHCHGRLRAQIPRMVQIGFDGVDCVESPPANDATLAEMLRLADGRLFLWGYIQFEDLAHRDGQQIDAMVREAVAAGGTTGRYVLGQAASPWSADIGEQTQRNWIRMIRTGAEIGH